MPKLEPAPGSRESSKEPSSRPTSSSSNLTNLTATQEQADKDVFVKPALPHSRSKSVITTPEDGQTSPPASPTKRFSPSKSTWLESAITKPDSPKPAPAARNSQPSWMADIAKAKAQRASGDSTPKPTEEETARPVSPTKAPFGQGMRKRSESRDLGTSRSGTPKIVETPGSRFASSTKNSFSRDSKELGATSDSIEKTGDTEVPRLTKKNSSMSIGSKPTSPAKLETKEDPPAPSSKEAAVNVDAADDRQHEPSASQPKDSQPSSTPKSKPEAPPKPQTDFRSTLRTRAPSEIKQQETPEFLSRFGNLKKTQTQNYVAPDVLKGNILRGKADLAKTGGPVKTQRRDELKESLMAKKEQWKKEKDEGIVYERKTSNPPSTPQKPEALAKRDRLRSESIKGAASPEKAREATPEALARHKSLKEKPKPEAALPALEKQKSEPVQASTQSQQPTGSSKMAAKFNPGLAGILARGPPARSGGSSPAPGPLGSATSTAAPLSTRDMSSEHPADGAQLQDMRKGRAKGPKRRKAGAKDVETDPTVPAASEGQPVESTLLTSTSTEKLIEPFQSDREPEVTPKLKPRAPPGSAASIMMPSLHKAPSSESKPSIPAKSPPIVSPKLPAEISTPAAHIKPADSPAPRRNDIPEFKGFGSAKKAASSFKQLEDNKEKAGEASPSVKSAASIWGRQPSPKKAEPPSQIQLPSKKDEEAAMRSAGLLASSLSRPGSSNGLGIKDASTNGNSGTPSTPSTAPVKPAKSSRAVSGQLQEASPNKGT